jgi:hypothetical protein
MLYILNTRRSLRSAGSSAGLGNSNTNQPPSGSRTRGQWRSGAGPVELSSLGGVQVRTQIETADTDGHYPVRLFFFFYMLSPFSLPCSSKTPSFYTPNARAINLTQQQIEFDSKTSPM